MDYLPIFLNLQSQPCLVVGGGTIAVRKAALLAQAGAKIRLVAPVIAAEIESGEPAHAYELIRREFSDADLNGMQLVIAATDNREINKQVSALCKSRGIPVNVVDNPEQCSFIMPSVIDRSPMQIAVSTGGASPVLARMLRTQLESSIPATFGNLAGLVEAYREPVKEALPTVAQRRHFWEKTLEGETAELVFAGKDEAARAALEESLEIERHQAERTGEVYLVGAGPGDPDLLTFRALRLMQKADVVVYDRLVSDAIMNLVRRDAEKIYVGKERDNHAVPQEDINTCLVRLAQEGKRVVRLKGGDPFIFGRGGEEISTLMDHGVNFQVVPGITAAAGCAAYAGIPLTHRDFSQAVTFVTGHRKDGTVDLNWSALAHDQQTVVFYMGLQSVGIICEQLIAHGRSQETPAALVEKGTRPDQKVYLGDLSSLPELVASNKISPPTLIIVGEVVTLRNKLQWFDMESEFNAGGSQ
ncbi:MAG: siroheme synthase CysG [Thiotrichales bacterium]